MVGAKDGKLVDPEILSTIVVESGADWPTVEAATVLYSIAPWVIVFIPAGILA